MYMLKGFINNSSFANATPGVIATIGELSGQSSTYSTKKGYYSLDATPHIELVSFVSNDSASGIVTPPAPLLAQVLTIAAFVYAKTQVTPNPGQIAAATLSAALLAQFQTSAQNFTLGTMVTDGTYWVPEWLQWENTTDATYGSIATDNTNLIKIWFTDASFQLEYDETSIVVIPPIPVLDNFFTTSTNVSALLSAQTYVDTMSLVQTAKAGNPETIIEAQTYDYVDPSLLTNRIPTNWTVLIYGPAGNNVDSIAEAIIAYILANSTHTQAEWTALLPDLFKRTEFTLAPLWDQLAVLNRDGLTGIYSPVANASRSLAVMNAVASTYTADHINSNCCVQTVPYNSIAVVSCGSPNNVNSEFQLEDVFPDILSVSSQSVDFGRMAAATQSFLLLLSTMLAAASTLTSDGDVPTGMTKLTRNGILYLVATYLNINYLMVVKANFPLTSVPVYGGDGVAVTTGSSDGSSDGTTVSGGQ